MGRKTPITIGEKWNSWTIIKKDKGRHVLWLCQCDCGNTTIVSSNNLVSGTTNSCGCKSALIKTHGLTNTRIYSIWRGIKTRTTYKCKGVHHNYIDKGITMCDEWQKPENFIKWAFANGYSDNLTIDRKDNDKGYCPENCRWVDNKTQQRNKSTNRYITYNGETKALIEWAEILNINYRTLLSRLRYGWDIERAFTTP